MQLQPSIFGLLGCQRIVQFFKGVLAELRLGLVLTDRADTDTQRFLAQHRDVFDLIVAGRRADTIRAMRAHLADSEQLVRKFVGAPPTAIEEA